MSFGSWEEAENDIAFCLLEIAIGTCFSSLVVLIQIHLSQKSACTLLTNCDSVPLVPVLGTVQETERKKA